MCIFDSFWTFLGTLVLIAVTLEGIEGIVREYRKDR